MNLHKDEILYILLALLVFFNSCGRSNDGGGSSASSQSTATPTSFYVNDVKELMPCNAQSSGFLAYVKGTSQFMACDGSNWAQVELKGKDGTSGTNGKDGTPVASNIWFDAVSGKTWLIPSLSVAFDAGQCNGNGYRIPGGSELVLAIQRGLLAKSATKYAWADSGADSYCMQATCQSGETAGMKNINQATAGHYCVSP